MNALSAVCMLREFIAFSRKKAKIVSRFPPYFGPLPSRLNMHSPEYSFQAQNEPKGFNFKPFLTQQNPKSLNIL